MPRTARDQSATGIYHVMIRGINRQDIFEAPEPDIEIREAVIKACGLRSISDFQLLTPYPGACPHDYGFNR